MAKRDGLMLIGSGCGWKRGILFEGARKKRNEGKTLASQVWGGNQLLPEHLPALS